MWRLLYCRSKLTAAERASLQHALDDVAYTCGAQLQDVGLNGKLGEVYSRDLRCYVPIENLYYSSGYTPICIYCAADNAQGKMGAIHSVRIAYNHPCTEDDCSLSRK